MWDSPADARRRFVLARLTLATLAILAIAAALSVALSQPSTARPVAVETLALEPTLGTIPPLTPETGLGWRLYFPMVAGDSEATE